VNGTIPNGCVYASLENMTGISQNDWLTRIGPNITTQNYEKAFKAAGLNYNQITSITYDNMLSISKQGGKPFILMNKYITSGHMIAVRKVVFHGEEYLKAIFWGGNPQPSFSDRSLQCH
jgi:hypothetical protein